MTAFDQIRHLRDVPMEVVATLSCKSLTIGQIAALERGQLIKTDCAAGDNVAIEIGGEPIAYAEVIVIGSNLGCRIAEFVVKD